MNFDQLDFDGRIGLALLAFVALVVIVKAGLLPHAVLATLIVATLYIRKTARESRFEMAIATWRVVEEGIRTPQPFPFSLDD